MLTALPLLVGLSVGESSIFFGLHRSTYEGALAALAASPAADENRAALLVRQTLTPNSGCVSACTTFAKDGQLFAGSVSALCSSTLVDASAQCYDCMVGTDLITQTVAQDSIDGASLPTNIECGLNKRRDRLYPQLRAPRVRHQQRHDHQQLNG
jgi:hypothetical protein